MIIDSKQIDDNSEEGQLLMAAIAVITTTTETDKTPHQVILKLQALRNTMFEIKE